MKADSDHDLRTSCGARVSGALVVALTLAAFDTLATRWEYEHRPLDVALFVQASVLWFVYALLACVPAWLFDRWVATWTTDKRFAHPTRAAARLAAWTALPVLAHFRLNQFTSIGGDLSALKSAAPWLQVLGVTVGMVAVCALVGRRLQRFTPRRAAIFVGALAVSLGAFTSFHEDDRPAQRGAPTEPRPNVVFLVWDTTRAQNLGLYGYERDTTPQLAALAERALVFTNAHSVSTYTLTSHLSMLTGMYPSHHGARMTRMRFNPLETPTVAKAFREAGYRTGAFVGTDVLAAKSGVRFAFESYGDRVDPWVTYTHGWALLHDVQAVLASKVPALRANGLPHWFQDFQRPASDVLAEARAWIDDTDPRPWFCFVNLYDVHWPYLPEPSARNKWVAPYDGIVDGYSKRGDEVHAAQHEFDARDQRHLEQLYDAELSQLDREVDAFLGALDLARTSVVVTSDHGEAFGEGGEYEHAYVLECQTHVPLIVRPAGGVEGRRLDVPVNGVDIAPTLLALAKLKPEAAFDGRDLLGVLPAQHELLIEDRDHDKALEVNLVLLSGRHKLVYSRNKSNEYQWRLRLFDREQDPNDEHDLAAAQPELAAQFKARMDALRAQWKADDERDGKDLDHGKNQALEALGYFDNAAKKDGSAKQP